MKKPTLTEWDMDLADVRKAKRLMNRALAELEKIEKRLKKSKQRASDQKGNREELALAMKAQGPKGAMDSD